MWIVRSICPMNVSRTDKTKKSEKLCRNRIENLFLRLSFNPIKFTGLYYYTFLCTTLDSFFETIQLFHLIYMRLMHFLKNVSQKMDEEFSIFIHHNTNMDFRCLSYSYVCVSLHIYYEKMSKYVPRICDFFYIFTTKYSSRPYNVSRWYDFIFHYT